MRTLLRGRPTHPIGFRDGFAEQSKSKAPPSNFRHWKEACVNARDGHPWILPSRHRGGSTSAWNLSRPDRASLAVAARADRSAATDETH